MDEREREDRGSDDVSRHVRAERSLPNDEPMRGLAAPGPSKVGTSAAMRARDVSRSGVAAREASRGQSVGAAGSSGSSPVDS
jgi:hypothetical protein